MLFAKALEFLVRRLTPAGRGVFACLCTQRLKLVLVCGLKLSAAPACLGSVIESLVIGVPFASLPFTDGGDMQEKHDGLRCLSWDEWFQVRSTFEHALVNAADLMLAPTSLKIDQEDDAHFFIQQIRGHCERKQELYFNADLNLLKAPSSTTSESGESTVFGVQSGLKLVTVSVSFSFSGHSPMTGSLINIRSNTGPVDFDDRIKRNRQKALTLFKFEVFGDMKVNATEVMLRLASLAGVPGAGSMGALSSITGTLASMQSLVEFELSGGAKDTSWYVADVDRNYVKQGNELIFVGDRPVFADRTLKRYSRLDYSIAVNVIQQICGEVMMDMEKHIPGSGHFDSFERLCRVVDLRQHFRSVAEIMAEMNQFSYPITGCRKNVQDPGHIFVKNYLLYTRVPRSPFKNLDLFPEGVRMRFDAIRGEGFLLNRIQTDGGEAIPAECGDIFADQDCVVVERGKGWFGGDADAECEAIERGDLVVFGRLDP